MQGNHALPEESAAPEDVSIDPGLGNVSNAGVITAESYTLGYQREAIDFVGRRRAHTHAAFLLPHLRPGMRLLDCGCGPGNITLGLARLVAPGEVVGIDREASQMEIAAAAAREQGITNTRFEPASIYDLPYDANSYDAVFAHALFEHLREPARALRELFRVLRPGGLVALRSPDWAGFLIHPNIPGVREAAEYFKFMQAQHGGDVHVGRKLKGLLLDAGFTTVNATASYECCEPLSYITDFLTARISASVERDKAVERGWTTHDKIQEMIDGLQMLGEESAGFFALAWCEVIGIK